MIYEVIEINGCSYNFMGAGLKTLSKLKVRLDLWMKEEQWTDECINEWTNECMNLFMNELISMHQWMNVCMNECMNDLINELMNELIN